METDPEIQRGQKILSRERKRAVSIALATLPLSVRIPRANIAAPSEAVALRVGLRASARAMKDVPRLVETQMRDALAKVGGFRFGVWCMVAVPMLEAWLLADEEAVVKVGGSRRVFGAPEMWPDPKKELVRLLRPRPYDFSVAERIAEQADIGKLARRCPSFEELREAVMSVE